MGRDGLPHVTHPYTAWEETNHHIGRDSGDDYFSYGNAHVGDGFMHDIPGRMTSMLGVRPEAEQDHVLIMRRHLKSADLPHTGACFLPSIAAAQTSAQRGHGIGSGNLSEARQQARRQLEDTQLIFRAVSR